MFSGPGQGRKFVTDDNRAQHHFVFRAALYREPNRIAATRSFYSTHAKIAQIAQSSLIFISLGRRFAFVKPAPARTGRDS
jgi:hypothetical protein